MKKNIFLYLFLILFVVPLPAQQKLVVSGVYPHLAYYNNEGECGTGAVVEWADRLWVITYGPHLPWGSSDKLYEIDKNLKVNIRPESVGGTPANRMIFKESNQLFIGPYLIDSRRNVRVISPRNAPGRFTGTARHLTDPKNKAYLATMEEGFYEVDLNTLQINTLYKDGNVLAKEKKTGHGGNLLPGYHGKGLYSGQGVLVYSNNGELSSLAEKQFDIESGCLAEWDGKEWKVVRRNQFTEVTGPGGICGNNTPETDPIWTTGWDHKSVLLGVRDADKWHFYRLPKASNTYDGAHGWNTEWPRIRDIGEKGSPLYLMTMHGMFWHFPKTFTSTSSSGIYPMASYLKVVGDFTRWNDQIVFGCDDSAQKEFLNKRKQKGNLPGPGQSNSNLWFVSPEKLTDLGNTSASGSVWENETVEARKPSDPFLFSGWENRVAWISNKSNTSTRFTFEIDKKGDNRWTKLATVSLKENSSMAYPFSPRQEGVWIRVISDTDTRATVSLVYTATEKRTATPSPIFKGLTPIEASASCDAILYGLGKNKRTAGMVSYRRVEGKVSEKIYSEIDETLLAVTKDDAEQKQYIEKNIQLPKNVVTVENSSVLVVDGKGRSWRLPLSVHPQSANFTQLMQEAQTRICREVATERDLFNCHGTFYELPAENADGFAKTRPISSHAYAIADYVSYRGLMLLSGILPDSQVDRKHIFGGKNTPVWAGVIDDLWKMGKPTGQGGPWCDTEVKQGDISDPYLLGGYDTRKLKISHTAPYPVVVTIEIDPTGNGNWMEYKQVKIVSQKTYNHTFPSAIHGRWIRFKTDKNTRITTQLYYL